MNFTNIFRHFLAHCLQRLRLDDVVAFKNHPTETAAQ